MSIARSMNSLPAHYQKKTKNSHAGACHGDCCNDPVRSNYYSKHNKMKELLKEARNKIIEAQVIVRPTDERWGKLDGAVGILEEIIIQMKDE